MDKNGSEHQWIDRHLWEIKPVADVLWAVGILLVIYIGYLLTSVVTPILLSLAIAYVFLPIIDYAEERWGLSRVLVTSMILIILLGLLACVIGWVGPVVVTQTITLLQNAPLALESLAERYNIESEAQIEQVQTLAEQFFQEPFSFAKPLISGTTEAFNIAYDVIAASVYLSITVILVPIYFFLFSLHYHRMLRYLRLCIPVSRRQRIVDILAKMDQEFSAFIRGRVIVGLIMAAMFAVGWCPLLSDVPYWLLLSILTGLLSLIPYAAGIGWLMALALKAIDLSTIGDVSTWHWVIGLSGPTIVYSVVQFIEGWFLTPWVQGKTTNLSSVTVLIVVFVGGIVWGLYGMILAIPLTACVKILMQDVIVPHLRHWARIH